MIDWTSLRLSDLCSSIDYGYTSSACSEPVGPKFLRITDIVGISLDWETVPFVEAPIEHMAKYKLEDEDIVIARTGATTGESYFISKPPMAIFASYLVRLKIKNSYDARFVSYWLKSPQFRQYLAGVLGDKSAQPNASASTMTNAPIRLPVCRTQQVSISTILGALDDKIDLNRRMNGTLEAMARAVFEDWFVAFGPVRARAEGRPPPGLAPEIAALFPDAFDADGRPVGWIASTVGAEFHLTMGQSPPGDTYNTNGNGLPFFQGRTDFGLRYPKRRVFCAVPARLADADDTLISVRAPVGDLNMAWERCCIGRGVAAARHRTGARGYTYRALSSLQPALAAFEHTGTVFGAINKAQFELIPIIAPGNAMIEAFERVIAPMDDRLRANESESATLAALRDLLLPRLMSGALRLREAERLVGDAA